MSIQSRKGGPRVVLCLGRDLRAKRSHNLRPLTPTHRQQ